MVRIFSWWLNLVYLAALSVFSPLIVWQAIRTGKYRDGYAEKFLGLVPRRTDQETCIWIHAVSVGEVNLMATTIAQLRAAHPDWQIVLSTTSRTGYELARKKYADLTVFYCPLDFSWAVRTAIRRVRPTLLVLAELELWPNLILAAKERGTRVAIINGRMSDHSFPGYRRIRPLISRLLRQIDFIAAQNEESAERFRALGAPADRVRVTGSLKYDGAQTDRNNSRTASLRQLANISAEDIVFLAGSTQEPEEQMAIDIYRRLSPQHPKLRLILVPRHPERFEAVAKVLNHSGLAWQRRTELENRRDPTGRRPIILVDTVGELGAWWGTATIAFVGGSLGSRGGQNMIEPAAYGAAVSFGPNTWNFRDVVAALVTADAAVVVRNANELDDFIRRCLDEPRYAAALGLRAHRLVQSQLGATGRTIALVDTLFSSETESAFQRKVA
ncbi:MAG TPA: 3-deoxy-D-manno-octulosonic acid transferase [Lacipirellulaceae bacterium]